MAKIKTRVISSLSTQVYSVIIVTKRETEKTNICARKMIIKTRKKYNITKCVKMKIV